MLTILIYLKSNKTKNDAVCQNLARLYHHQKKINPIRFPGYKEIKLKKKILRKKRNLKKFILNIF